MKKNKTKESLGITLVTVFVVVSLWIGITSTIQRFKCTSMTETELFLYIPKSVICNWKHCN